MPASYKKRQAALREAEQRLRQDVAREHGSPFIAHHDLPGPLRQAAASALIAEVDGEIDTFIGYIMGEYPHLALWTVATSVAEGYNIENRYSVYPQIATRLGGLEIPTNRREAFNRSFKSTCASLGLMLPIWSSLAGDLVDDYLFQAGVPTGQLKYLVHAFLRAERASGLPAFDDTADINAWEDAAMEFVQPGLTRIREIIRDDSTGYHAMVFLRMRSGAVPTTAFEHRILKEIEDTGQQCRDLQPPLLAFGDAALLISGSPRGVPIIVEVGTRLVHLEPGETHAMPPPWPHSVRWCPSAHDSHYKSLPIFSDPNRSLLVFDGRSGRHKGELIPARGNRQRVPGGSVAIVSTQPFQANGTDAYLFGESAYVLFCDLSTRLQIRQDDTVFVADVDARPRLEIDGLRIARHADGWLIAGPTIVRLQGDLGGLGNRLEISVEHPSMPELRRTSVVRAPNGEYVAPLNDLPRYGTFGMAKITVHAKHQVRALYRYRFWYWPGLNELRDDGVFDAVSIPVNLDDAHLMHVTMDSDGRLRLRRDATYLQARVAFAVDRRVICFTFPPPGVSMLIRTSTGEESAIAIGTRLEITGDRLASHVVVRCQDPSAAIDCKGDIIRYPFDKSGLWRQAFAALSAPGKHNVVRLLIGGREDDALELLRIGPDPEHSARPELGGRSLNVCGQRTFEKLVAVECSQYGGNSQICFTALVVTGDRDGRVGYGIGSGDSPAIAIRRSTQRAHRAMVSLRRHRDTIPHRVEGKFGAACVMLEPTAPGTGMVVSHPVRKITEGAGIRDVRAEARGSERAMDIVRAAFAALDRITDHDESPTEYVERGT